MGCWLRILWPLENDWACFCCWKESMYFLHVNLSRNCQLSSKTTRFQLRWIEETKTPCSLPGDQPVQKPDMGYPDRTNQGGQKVVVLEIAQVVSSRNKNHTNFNCTNENAKTYHKRQFVVAMLTVLVIRGIKRKRLNTNLRLLANALLNKARGLHTHYSTHYSTLYSTRQGACITIIIVALWPASSSWSYWLYHIEFTVISIKAMIDRCGENEHVHLIWTSKHETALRWHMIINRNLKSSSCSNKLPTLTDVQEVWQTDPLGSSQVDDLPSS